jgi:hypothetical protein
MFWWAVLCAVGGVGFLLAAQQQATIGVVSLGSVIFTGGPLSNLVTLALAAAVVVMAILATTTLPGRKAPPDLLFGIAFGAPGLALLAGGREWMVIRETARRLHVTNARVPAPSMAEALLVIALGLLTGALAAALFALAKARTRSA